MRHFGGPGAGWLAPWKIKATEILLPWFLHCSPLIAAERQGDTKAKPYKIYPGSTYCSYSYCGLRKRAAGPWQKGEEVMHGKCTWGSSLTMALLMQFSFSLAPLVQILMGWLRTNWHRLTGQYGLDSVSRSFCSLTSVPRCKQKPPVGCLLLTIQQFLFTLISFWPQ